MTDENSATEAEKQQNASDWPLPGDEGYVIPDGTPQAERQLAENRRAAADRAMAGSTVHGAPMATPGPQAAVEAAAAQERADKYSGPTDEDRTEGVTESIREGFEAATEKAEKSEQDATPSAASKPSKRTADESKPQTQR